MKIFLFISLFFGSMLYAEQNSKSAYEAHLPKDIYLYCVKNDLINEDSPKNSKELQDLDGVNQLDIEIDTLKRKQFVLINYNPAKIKDNFGGIELGYRNHKLMSYAIFDAEGSDYVAHAPFSKHDENAIVDFILNKIFPVFKKGD